MKSISILVTLLIVNLNSFCQDTTYYFENLYEKKAIQFIANKTKFRMCISDTMAQTFAIEKYNEGWQGWVLIDSIDDGYGKFYLKDINKDGFNDLVLSAKWQKEVYFFNPINKNFIHTGSFCAYCWLGDDKEKKEEQMILLDKKNHIYYDHCSYKRDEWSSSLFTIKNYKRIDLGEIFIESSYTRKQTQIFTKSIIKVLTEDKKTIIRKYKPSVYDTFNYASYWKLNWRKFLH